MDVTIILGALGALGVGGVITYIFKLRDDNRLTKMELARERVKRQAAEQREALKDAERKTKQTGEVYEMAKKRFYSNYRKRKSNDRPNGDGPGGSTS